jgi:hypothetical protein
MGGASVEVGGKDGGRLVVVCANDVVGGGRDVEVAAAVEVVVFDA